MIFLLLTNHNNPVIFRIVHRLEGPGTLIKTGDSIFNKSPPDESGGCVIETKTNDCPSVMGTSSYLIAFVYSVIDV